MKHLHRLTIRDFLYTMRVEEKEDEIVCELSAISRVHNIDHSHLISAVERDQLDDWFSAIVTDLRENSDKTIHLFDRQHVMTT